MTFGAFQPRSGSTLILNRDTAVTDHDPLTHAETWFHIPGDGNWTDDEGNITITGPTSPTPINMYVPGVSSNSVNYFFEGSTAGGWESNRDSPAGEFTYNAPGSLGFGPFSIACLVRFPTDIPWWGQNQYILCVKGSGAFYGLQLGADVAEGTIRADFTVLGAADEIISTSIYDGNWHHICATATGSETLDDWTIRLYVDGVKIGSDLTNRLNPVMTHNNVRVFIGSRDENSSARFRGCARSFIGIRKQLSDAEVAALSTATIGTP